MLAILQVLIKKMNTIKPPSILKKMIPYLNFYLIKKSGCVILPSNQSLIESPIEQLSAKREKNGKQFKRENTEISNGAFD